MRKILSVLLVSLLIFSFAACGSGKNISQGSGEESTETSAQESSGKDDFSHEGDYANKKLEVFMMKKVITVLISLLMILSLAACGNSASLTGQPSTEEKPTAGTVNSEEPVENSTDAENTATSEGQTNEPENPENPDIPEEQGTKVLVAYFPLPIQHKG